ncbi:MAG: hypothetical protein E5W31_00930, partial [Mesorhizobium sp.]
WDTEAKLAYIDDLDREGILPTVAPKPKATPPSTSTPTYPASQKPSPPKAAAWPHLIPNVDYGVTWTAHLQRHREIWEELQFKLRLSDHPNAISVLLRVLLELSVDNYVKETPLSIVNENDNLSRKAVKVAEDMYARAMIDKKYLGVINKLQHAENLISMDTLNRYVHSPNFNVSPEHLKMLWGTLSSLVVLCLTA